MPRGSLVRLAYYPFLPEVRETVRTLGVSANDLLEAPRWEESRQRGLQKVKAVLEGQPIPSVRLTNDGDAKVELLSGPVAKLLIAWTREKTLAKRFAEAEADRTLWYFEREESDGDLLEIAEALGYPFRTKVVLIPSGTYGTVEQTKYEMPFATYLKIGKPSGNEWKLVGRIVEAGWVQLERKEIPPLLGAELRERVKTDTLAEIERGMDEESASVMESIGLSLEGLLQSARDSWTTGDFGPVQPGLFPPCIKELFAAMGRSEMVPHHGRFAFATFLGTIGWNSEQIMDYMATLPNFDREKSRYQIEHVTGQRGVDKYTPPGCATMQTNGVCPLDKRDGLCLKIKHPLSYYRAKLRFAANDAAKVTPAPSTAAPAAPTTVKP